MAAFDTSRAPAVSSVIAGRLGAQIVSFFGAVTDWNEKRLTRKQLHSLSERELQDIGLARGDIDTVIARGAYKA